MGLYESKLESNKYGKSQSTEINGWIKNRGESGEKVNVEVVCDSRTWNEKWYVAVQLKQFKTPNPMQKIFDSLHCNAIVLSFLGKRHEIC